jgi:hypothetical protein
VGLEGEARSALPVTVAKKRPTTLTRLINDNEYLNQFDSSSAVPTLAESREVANPVFSMNIDDEEEADKGVSNPLDKPPTQPESPKPLDVAKEEEEVEEKEGAEKGAEEGEDIGKLIKEGVAEGGEEDVASGGPEDLFGDVVGVGIALGTIFGGIFGQKHGPAPPPMPNFSNPSVPVGI